MVNTVSYTTTEMGYQLILRICKENAQLGINFAPRINRTERNKDASPLRPENRQTKFNRGATTLLVSASFFFQAQDHTNGCTCADKKAGGTSGDR